MAKKESPRNERTNGKTTIAPRVLVTIARLTTLSITGVSRMASVPGGVNRIFHRGIGEGVRIEIEDNQVSVDLYVVLEKDVHVREVSINIQNAISRAITEMVGLQTKTVNIHIEEIQYAGDAVED
ncbi:MAG: Asp23/Gls24 family envelope stress response protein [Anaerolineales bacterium]|nr:Asp23/Gls24 family envelope stress response protein [Anaerolineales bacterium]